MIPDSILEEAARILDGERAEAYGDPNEMCQRIADLWTPILRARFVHIAGPDTERALDLRPSDVAMCLLQLKVAREINKPSKDNRVDMAGYATILDRVTPKSEAEKKPSYVEGPRVVVHDFNGVTEADVAADAAKADAILRRIKKMKFHDGGVVNMESPSRLGEGASDHVIPRAYAEKFGLDDVGRRGDVTTKAESSESYDATCSVNFAKTANFGNAPKTDSTNEKTDFENGKSQAEKPKCEAIDIPNEGWWSPGAKQFVDTECPADWKRVQIVRHGRARLDDDRRVFCSGVMLAGTSLFWHTLDKEYHRIAAMPAAVEVRLVEAAP